MERFTGVSPPRGRRTLEESSSSGTPKPDGRARLVCFDIPERDRAKRRWLRGGLLDCGYRPIQKSVWIGNIPLPENFMKDLDALELRGKVHIFPLADLGTFRDRPEEE